MRLSFLSRRRNRKPNWFAWGIFLYIVLGSAWFYSQLPNNSDTQEEQAAPVMGAREAGKAPPDVKSVPPKKSPPYDIGVMENVFIGTAQVTSGKTFKLVTPAPEPWRERIVRRIQLYGVDTCETRQVAKRDGQEWPCGAVVTAWLVTKTLSRDVVCRPSIVRSGVIFSQCFVDGIDIAEMGLSEGMLIVAKDKENPPPSQYIGVEQKARVGKLGLWSSGFDDPAQWRRNNGTYNPFDPR